MRFRKILWTKNVALSDGSLAYSGQDPSVKAREPKKSGDLFELHSTPEDAESLGDPSVGDLLVLTQHGQATHLVEVIGSSVEPRSRRTMRKGTRDFRFTDQRTCRLIALHDFDSAPFVEDAFGFDPKNEGGEVFRLNHLPSFESANQPLWAIQKRLEQHLDGTPNLRQLFLSRDKGPSPEELITRELEAELLSRSPIVSAAPIPSEAASPRRKLSLRTSHRRLGPGRGRR